MGKRKNKKRASAAFTSAAVPAASRNNPAPAAPAASTSSAPAPPAAPVHSSTAPSPEIWSSKNFTGVVTLGDLCDPKVTPNLPDWIVLKGVWTSANLKDFDISTRTQTQSKQKNKTSLAPRRRDKHLAILVRRPKINFIDRSAEMELYITTGLSGTGDTDMTRPARETYMTFGDLLIPNECTTPLPPIKNLESKPSLVTFDNYYNHPSRRMNFTSDQRPRVCDQRSWTIATTVTETQSLDTEATPGEGTLKNSLLLEVESARSLRNQAIAFDFAQNNIGGDGTGIGRGGGRGGGPGGGSEGGARRQGGRRTGRWNRRTSGARNRQKDDTTWEDGQLWYWCADGRGYRYGVNGSIIWCFPPGYVTSGEEEEEEEEDHQAILDFVFAKPGEDPKRTRKNAEIAEWVRQVS
ncbi:hypothetical protein C8J57DRAFT_1705611 [Mycena rebaudengoi]|nr:hypothetical protein C8J57DRAFT_1705611 [Mycena rebaudengoi]